jgi:hypothetical protein
MSQICPLIKQPCIKEGCEMWLSIEMDTSDDKESSNKLHFDDCAFRIIAGRPIAQQNEMDREHMTGN